MSVIFEGVEMPTACCFVDGEHSAFAHFEYCKFYNICKKRDTIKTNCKPSDCPVKALEQEPTTKNDSVVDAVSREDVHDMLENLPVTVEDKWFNWLQKACMRLAELPAVIPPLCADCNFKMDEIRRAYDKVVTEGHVLDKIRAEIEQGYCKANSDYDHGRNYGLYMATQIIDKYKTEK